MKLFSRRKYTDAQLVAAIREEEPAAFKQLYHENFGMIKKMVREKGGQLADAKDVFQEAMIILMGKVREKDFKLTAKLSTFFYGIASNVWNNIRKREKRYTDFDQAFEEGSVDSLLILSTDERLPGVEKALNGLGEGCQELIQMYFIQQLTYSEIAGYLDKSAGYLKVKMHRCMGRLRAAVSTPSSKP